MQGDGEKKSRKKFEAVLMTLLMSLHSSASCADFLFVLVRPREKA